MATTQEERLQNFLNAEKKALLSQEYRTGSRKNRRADLDKISKGVDSLLAAGADGVAPAAGTRSRRVVLRDL